MIFYKTEHLFNVISFTIYYKSVLFYFVSFFLN